MLNSSTNSPTKDAVERLNNWLDVLEKRIHALLDTNDPELLTPAQREQAASRHLMMMYHFLQQLQKYADAELSEDEDDPAIVMALIRGDRID